MTSIQHDLDSFTEYAKRKLQTGESPRSIDDLYDQWRDEHVSTTDALAIAASLRDLEDGEQGKNFGEFATEFSARSGLMDFCSANEEGI